MPAKSKEDERKWNKAEQLAAEKGQAGNYAYIMGIYKKMNPDQFKSASLRSQLIRLAYERPELRSALLPLIKEGDYEPGERTPGGFDPGVVVTPSKHPGEGSQTPPARDIDGQLVPVKDYGILEIPGYKWQERDGPEISPTASTKTATFKLANVYYRAIKDFLSALTKMRGAAASQLERAGFAIRNSNAGHDAMPSEDWYPLDFARKKGCWLQVLVVDQKKAPPEDIDAGMSPTVESRIIQALGVKHHQITVTSGRPGYYEIVIYPFR